jgi:nucleoid-associated protein EbfC
MADVFKMMKQFRDLRRMQKELESKTAEASSPDGLIAVEARGDMSLRKVEIKPEALQKYAPEKLGKVLVSTINSALDAVKKEAAADMQKMAGGMGGLSNLLGGG